MVFNNWRIIIQSFTKRRSPIVLNKPDKTSHTNYISLFRQMNVVLQNMKLCVIHNSQCLYFSVFSVASIAGDSQYSWMISMIQTSLMTSSTLSFMIVYKLSIGFGWESLSKEILFFSGKSVTTLVQYQGAPSGVKIVHYWMSVWSISVSSSSPPPTPHTYIHL